MGRKLRVDYSTEGRVDGDDPNMSSAPSNQTTNGASHVASQSSPAGALPPLPPGKELPPGVSATDAISRTLNALPPGQLLDVLQQMKSLTMADPARAAELLEQAPQLSYAIFQGLLLMGLVQPEAIHSVIDTSAAPPALQTPASYPPAYAGPSTSTPPVAAPYAPPPVTSAPQASYAPPAAAAPAAALGQDPESLMAAVMTLPQDMIDQLPETERNQIMALRAAGFAGQQR